MYKDDDYKERDNVEDRTEPVTITLDSNLFHNLKMLRKKKGLKTLSGRINDLLWAWFNNQIKKYQEEKSLE